MPLARRRRKLAECAWAQPEEVRLGSTAARKGRRTPLEAWIHSDLRQDENHALALLTESFHDDHEGTFLVALRHMVLAQGGMAKTAKASGLNRESLYKALSRGGNPGVDTLRKILAALKIKVAFVKG